MNRYILMSALICISGCKASDISDAVCPKRAVTKQIEFAPAVNTDGFTTRIDSADLIYPAVFVASENNDEPKGSKTPSAENIWSVAVKYTYINETKGMLSEVSAPSIHLRSPAGEIYYDEASSSMSNQSQNFALAPGEWGSQIRIFNVPKSTFDRRTWKIVFNGENRGQAVPMTNADIFTFKNGDQPPRR